MKKPQFVEGQIYHIYNRGVEKRKTFLSDKDYLRFIHDLYEFNDIEPVLNVQYYFSPKMMLLECQHIERRRKPKKLLVEILAFVLMSNHFHLILRQKAERGIIRFMQKLGTGYSMYFNGKYKRVGALFQGRFKAIRVYSQAHFLYLPFYIHANPVLKIYGGSTSIDWRRAMRILEKYRWSSFLDYIGKKNFPSVTSRKFLSGVFGGEAGHRKEMEQLLCERSKTKRQLQEIQDILFDNDVV